MKRNLVVLFVLVALVGMASAKSKAGKESVNITLDQKQLEGKPEAVMSAWMGYGMARADWISEHVLGKSDRPKDYHRGFEEELAGIFEAAKAATNVRLVGLMLLPPAVDDPDAARPYFRRLCDVRRRLLAQGIDASSLQELSMGMSQDFEAAIEEGATIVRVGTAIFGGRTYR